MKISYNWLQEYFNKPLPQPSELADILTTLGLEVEKITYVGLDKDYLSQFIVSEVIEVKKHPNADKLRLAKVDTGSQILNIVCGAPNLFNGQKVVLAPIGSTLGFDHNDKFIIKKSKIRGEVSEGMLCSEQEIGISDNHKEIISMPENAEVGASLNNYYETEPLDSIFEIAITPNRGDALSYMGLATDISAKLNIDIVYPKLFTDIKPREKEEEFLPKINILAHEDCVRYIAAKIKDVQIGPSPKWIKEKLAKMGVNSINNIVDFANMVMFETGQPIHAFDLDLIGSNIDVRLANKREKILTLDSKEKTLDDDILIIADSNKVLCIAGLIGGQDSAINNNTKNILLEFAHFKPERIRNATKKYNIVTDAAFRFERYVDPNLATIALNRMIYLLNNNNIISDTESISILDYYPEKRVKDRISINYNYINDSIGIDIDKDEITNILKRLNFDILEQTDCKLTLQVPTTKSDVKEPIDIVEEILRIYGYDKIQKPSKISLSIRKNHQSEFIHDVQNSISNFLTDRGYYQVINNSLIKSIDILQGDTASENIVKLLNPLSQDLNILRYSLMPPILENISYNKRRQKHNLKLYEIGNIYEKNISYTDSMRLAIAITGMQHPESWTEKVQKTTFFSLKGIVDSLLLRLGLKNYNTSINSNSFSDNVLNYEYNKNPFGFLGEIKGNILNLFSIKSQVFYAEFDLSKIINMLKTINRSEHAVSIYPSIRRDLSLILKDDVLYDDLVKQANRISGDLLKDINIFDLYIGDKIPDGHKSYSLSFIFQSDNKTLSDSEVDLIIDKIIQSYDSVGVKLRAN